MPPTERKFLATAGSAGGRVIPTPFEFFTTGEDNIRVTSANSVLGVSLKINMRFVDIAGTITATSWDHTPNTDRSKKTTDYALGQGAVMNLTVFASAGTPLVGQTFVIVQLIRGSGPAAIVLGTLLQGYVTTTQALGWPGSPIVSSTEGEPCVRTIGATLPALGANISETVPAGARWELLSLLAVLTTSLVAGNRQAYLVVDNGADIVSVVVLPGPVPTGSGWFVSWGAGLVSTNPAGSVILEAPLVNPLPMRAGQRFRTLTAGIDVSDHYDTPFYTVREWLEVP